ncbi:hypothetical protein Tco_1186206 [Tanacetum coccineum]
MARKGVKFSGKVTLLFDSMLVPHQAPKGKGLEQPTEPQPTPSPSQFSTRNQPPVTASSSSHELHKTLGFFRRHNGSERDSGSVLHDSLFRLITQSEKDAQAAEILKLKDQIKKLKRKCKPSISHHKAWLKSVKRLSMKKRLGRKESKQRMLTLDAFDDLDADGRDYIETEDVVNEGRKSNETKELNKGSGDKGESIEELVSTVVPKTVSTARPDVDVARQEDSDVEPITPPTTTSIFDDEIHFPWIKNLIKVKEEKLRKKGVIKDIPAKKMTRSDFDATQIARDVEIARQLQVDLKAEVERERQREEEASKAAIAETYDEVQEGIDVDALSAEIRSRPPTKSQLRNLMMMYLKNMGDDAVKDSKEAAGVHKQKVLKEPNSTKVEVKEEGHKESIRKRPGRRLKMKAEDMREFDSLDLVELYNLVMKRFETTTPKGVDLVLWGDLRTIVHTLILEDGTEIHMLVERKYPLTKETLERMMSLKLIVESASESAYNLLRHQELASPEQTASANALGKASQNPLDSDSLPQNYMVINAPCYYNEALAIPEQTATGKEILNPFMAGSLPKTRKPT